jgi:hypothetical protein
MFAMTNLQERRSTKAQTAASKSHGNKLYLGRQVWLSSRLTVRTRRALVVFDDQEMRSSRVSGTYEHALTLVLGAAEGGPATEETSI